MRVIRAIDAGLAVLFCVSAGAAPTSQERLVTFRSQERRTSLVELYTSEGCSSCPPAEAWLNRLKNSPRLWTDFVPVAFHVDYWDHLGWRDPHATKEFTERQWAHGESWGRNTVYTPCFVLNGKEWRGWPSLKDGPPAILSGAGVLTATSSNLNHWQVHFSPQTPVGAGYEVHAVLLAGGLISEVKAGENRERRLVHEFVAVELANGMLHVAGNKARGEFSFGDVASRKLSRAALAVWVTVPGKLEPIQATGGWLLKR